MPFVELDDVGREFVDGDRKIAALSNVSLSFERSEFAAIIGPSGAGKSTLLSILGALIHPTTGKVKVDGMELTEMDAESLANFRREYVGFVFQSFNLLPYLTALENVMLPLAIAKGNGVRRKALAEKALESVGMIDKAKRLPGALSAGEQQRVAIARAIVNNPPIVLADEPTGNLDSVNALSVIALLSKLAGDNRLVIIVTHNEQITSLTTRTIALDDGKVTLDHNKLSYLYR